MDRPISRQVTWSPITGEEVSSMLPSDLLPSVSSSSFPLPENSQTSQRPTSPAQTSRPDQGLQSLSHAFLDLHISPISLSIVP
ncbi:hypothetical protein DPEC_G00029470 [Dallia pectoralis]|uniref:Uncharacterized protein n=1 Tax=Dallia pectoralis TaxID=75939 RepID=A0ACC2HJV0_DALPE|nr:hypothetical protein DPEC_G00029470 [Dallia pectoralis]